MALFGVKGIHARLFLFTIWSYLFLMESHNLSSGLKTQRSFKSYLMLGINLYLIVDGHKASDTNNDRTFTVSLQKSLHFQITQLESFSNKQNRPLSDLCTLVTQRALQ